LALLVLGGVLIASSGCGTAGITTPAAQRLQREDLVAVCRALKSTQRSVSVELAAAKPAWRLIVNGLPATAASARPSVAAATASSQAVEVPALLSESQAVSLTGPAAQLAGLFRSFVALTSRGWKLIGAAITQVDHGSPASARFARENVPLYIESVYDGHFSLAQTGKKLLDAYRKLGGPAAFGSALTEGEVDALVRAYSEAADRLHPHVGVRLGS
jgi:hypothetical protein